MSYNIIAETKNVFCLYFFIHYKQIPLYEGKGAGKRQAGRGRKNIQYTGPGRGHREVKEKKGGKKGRKEKKRKKRQKKALQREGKVVI